MSPLELRFGARVLRASGMAKPPNHHFIPRVVTKDYVDSDGNFRVFDLCLRAFRREPASQLFARRGLNSPHLERWFHETIENPLGRVLEPFRKGRLPWPADPTAEQYRAFAMLFLLTAPRIESARGGSDPMIDLNGLPTSDEADQLTRAFYARRQILWVPARERECFFFPESALFAHPLWLRRPALVMPLGPTLAVLVHERSDSIDSVMAALDDCEPVRTALSMGVGSGVHRVLVPPNLWDASTSDPDGAARALLEVREAGQHAFNLLGGLGARLGGLFPSWHAT